MQTCKLLDGFSQAILFQWQNMINFAFIEFTVHMQQTQQHEKVTVFRLTQQTIICSIPVLNGIL